ncbi:MAG: hypothetical protein LBG84_04695 [Treponema sp.]|jgi:hypothetical protein|nr:hypothetical protein [Treponema sp.]
MKKTLTICLILLCAAAAFADEKVAMPRLEIPTARSAGMGGAHVAYTDNVFGLLINPSAIMRVNQRSAFAISPTLLNPQSTFQLIKPVRGAVSGDVGRIGDAMDILSKKHGKVPLGLDLREFPLSIAWVANGLGFGLWDRVFVNPNIIGTTVEMNVYGDVMLPVGFAVKVLDAEHHKVDAGIVIKPFVRIKTTGAEVQITELMDNSFDFMDHFSVPVILGAGVDMGLTYRWTEGFTAGITFADIFTRGKVVGNIAGEDTNSYYIPFSLNLGAAYDFKIGKFWADAPRFVADMGIAVMADWHDFVNIFQQDDYLKRNAKLNFSAGLQVSMFNDIFMVRAGMNEMLPAVGLGMDLGTFEVNLAYYGKELGLEPGQLSAAALDLTIAFRPDAKKRDWPWNKRSLVGMIAKSENL